MTWLPFISVRSHAAVIASKDAQIRDLHLLIDYLKENEVRERDGRAKLEEKVVDLVAKTLDRTAAPQPPLSRRPAPPPDREPDTLDLAMVDPSDIEAIALIARREMPTGQKLNASMVMRKVESLREKIIEAHAAREARLQSPGYIPERLNDRIQEAVRQGEAAALHDVGA